MKIELLHYTPQYHKLIESTARECYQSFDKLNPESHKMLKGIMSVGHVSVASVGNMVFGINGLSTNEFGYTLSNLSTYKEINPYIRWSMLHKLNKDSNFDFVVSFNILTLIDIVRNIDKYTSMLEDQLITKILDILKNIPEVYWFIDDSTYIEPVENPYRLTADLGKPVVLAQDYTYLKDILTPYELDLHTTVTVNMVYDRATSLQVWRHASGTGGCEVSQRYVDMSNARYRIPTDIQGEKAEGVYKAFMDDHIDRYVVLKEMLKDKGKKRSQEIARNLLPNILTNVIQTRPLREWKHFFKLRDTSHAQLEIMQDTQALKQAFIDAGIEL